ncbi:oligoendopeptidase F [Ligilactobacillus hayakitensis DSM 18933 = JCM 14209]|uniref:Oligopeptidase F n=1 Tax=Ligilactobacillus hayakitensis DSM 18933 = JCM 14209 TaxID=1423755 RepID=A0A0R1WN55_9LACO|nr:oligoendopeptidase F [Ligilactobacillus hayakitensis]KRM19218.1 oligoendopeptidase F [Ligilactobacillus hayakitensis DSM 18933 = JCM 14209]
MTQEIKKLPKRSEVDEKLTWDLTKVFADDTVFEQELKNLNAQINEFAQAKGSLSKDAHQFKKVLNQYLDLMRRFEKAYVYASMKNDQDTADTKYQGYQELVSAQATKFEEATSWFEPELMALPEEVLNQYYESEPELNETKHFIDGLLLMKAHTLDAQKEEMLASASEIFQTSENVFEILNNADLKFPIVEDEEGKQIQLSHGTYATLIQSTDRKVRKEAFEKLYETYDQFKHTFATTLLSHVKGHNFNAKIRNFDSARQASLYANHIPESVYDTLLKQVHKHLPLLHRYVALRKKLLHVEELHMYDIYTPITGKAHLTYTYEEAKKEALEALSVLGKDYTKHVQEAFDERWIDVVENQGKRSGAYSSGTYDTAPYMLLNWQDNLENLYTLVHEMGHSMHSWYTTHNQPYQYGDYSIFLAEIASTTNENLLTDYLLKKYPQKEIQQYILNHYLDGVKGTIFRQAQFAEFEQWIHQQNQAGNPLTAKEISEYYQKLNEKYYGPDVISDPQIALEWARIPHFYYNFYVYQYATGFACASALSQAILSGDATKVDGYLDYLKAGSSDYPLEVMKKTGVDMTQDKYLEDAFDVFEKRLDQLEKSFEK